MLAIIERSWHSDVDASVDSVVLRVELVEIIRGGILVGFCEID